MLTGIIISTQSPSQLQTFPRLGGTAYALHQATKHEVIKMHRDGQARGGYILCERVAGFVPEKDKFYAEIRGTDLFYSVINPKDELVEGIFALDVLFCEQLELIPQSMAELQSVFPLILAKTAELQHTREVNEIELLDKLEPESIIYITGHGGAASSSVSGTYVQTPSQVESEGGVLTRWSLTNYRDLILDNASKIKPGDWLTIVLWACESGANGLESSAVQLGQLFLQKGINTRIISSTLLLDRFNGIYDKNEDPNSKIRFRSYPFGIRMFECSPDGIFETSTNKQVYCTPKGVEFIPHFKSQLLFSREVALYLDKRYFNNCKTPSDAESCLKESKQDLIMRRSSKNYEGYRGYTATFYLDKQVKHARYMIDTNGNLFFANNTEKTDWRLIEHICGSFFETISQDVFFRFNIIKPAAAGNIILASSSIPVMASREEQEFPELSLGGGEEKSPAGSSFSSPLSLDTENQTIKSPLVEGSPKLDCISVRRNSLGLAETPLSSSSSSSFWQRDRTELMALENEKISRTSFLQHQVLQKNFISHLKQITLRKHFLLKSQ